MKAHLLLCADKGWWAMGKDPANATYGQLLVLLRALQRNDEEPKPLPKRVWQDFLKNRKRNNGPS